MAYDHTEVRSDGRKAAGIGNPDSYTAHPGHWWRGPIGEHELKLAPIAYEQRDPVAWLAACNVYRSLLPDEAIERATYVLDQYEPPRPGPIRSVRASIDGMSAEEVARFRRLTKNRTATEA
ncbi:hypothetical protein [Bosea sp. ANAM02]|uniref:hypothetical protein n=1 Tax=Bosea sp. ANAM02 TaxID=2020412 RepID=UPI00140EEC7B|nr:hypothetical protein [Bosea sp. ANAM02]BCB20290.1 hypothetical protein OCUBac02_31840 [Bosea sp. ANAM02]